MEAQAFARSRGGAARVIASRMLARSGVLLASFLALGAQSAGAGLDKQLARVSGDVAYQAPANAQPVDVVGRIVLPDDYAAITFAKSRARITLADSSVIEIGATTRVRLGAFDAIRARPEVVTLELGTIHFIIRRPAGGQSNYRFVTPTSQIAVRGTEGYLVTGPSGTDFYCVNCAKGDVTVTVGARSYELGTGEQAIVIGTPANITSVDVVARPCANPAAIDLSDGAIGGAIPVDQRFDTTGAPGGDPTKAVPVNS